MKADRQDALPWTPAVALGVIEGAGERDCVVTVTEAEGLRALSGRDMAALIRGAAAAFADAGIGRGDAVAIWAPNSPEWIAAGFACHLLGVMLAPLDAMLGVAEARQQALDSRVGLVLVPETSRDDWGAEVPVLAIESIAPSDRPLPQVDYDADLPIALFRTSGTTGKPKIFHLTLGNIGSNVHAITASGAVTGRDRVLLPLPMHHVFPWITATLGCLTIGATVVLPESPTGPHIAEALKLARPSILIGVPRLYEAMLAGIRSRLRAMPGPALKTYDGLLWLALRVGRAAGGSYRPSLLAPVRRMIAPSLRMAVSGGAHLPAEVEEELEVLGFDVRGGYGLAETAGSITAPIGGKRIGSVGRALPGCDIRIDNPNGEGIGEILLKGPEVFSGYLDHPEANAAAFTEDGYFRTGDLGRLDKDGFLFVTGRAKEVIVLAGGDNVFPEDVEKRYLAEPVIAEIGVMEREGALVAVVVPDMAEIANRKLIDPQQIISVSIAMIGKTLPSTWRLSGFVLSHEPLPRTRLMKLRRFMLPKIYEDLVNGREAARPTEPTGADADWVAREPQARVWRLLHESFPDKSFSLDGYVSYDLGLDSFGWMNLSLDIERATGVRLSVADIARIATVRDLLTVAADLKKKGAVNSTAAVEAEVAAAAAEWLGPRTPRERVMGVALHAFNRALMAVYFRLRATGRENLSGFADKAVLICPNHASELDALAVAAAVPGTVRPRLRWSGSRGAAFATWFRRTIARPTGMFPVDQAAPMLAIGMAVEALRQGMAQVWFPEGLLTPDGRLLPFREGVGHVVLRAGAPVVPAVISGSYEARPREGGFAKPHPIRVIFGAPVPAAELTEGLDGDPEAATRIAGRLREKVLALAAANGIELEPRDQSQ